MKTKIFTLFLALAASAGTMFAGIIERVQIGDLYYNLDATNRTAEVTSQNSSRPYWSTTVTTADIPASVSYKGATYSVTNIGGWAFCMCTGLTSVTIPNSVTGIGDCAFYYCTGLTSVTIPNSVTSIGDEAFCSCTGITSVTLGNSVTSIGVRAFGHCSRLTSSIVIPKSVTSIGDEAFVDCYPTSITIEAETPPTLAVSAFERTGNSPIYVPCGTMDTYKTAWSSYTSRIKYKSYPSYIIEKSAENGYITTSSTELFTICDEEHPVTCTAIPDRGFYFVRWADGNTDNPRTIELTQDTTMEAIFDYILEGKCGKDNVLTWKFNPSTMALDITGKGALSENYTYGTFIESLTIGNEVTSIGQSAFYRFENLKHITLGSSLKVLEGNAFYGCSSLTSVTIPNSVTSIGEGAFASCSQLTSIEIPNSITSIGVRAFYGCNSLKNVILGSSIKVLESGAFAYCSAIETITCYSQRPPTVNQDALYGLDYSTIVYVPADYLNTYKMHDAWGLYDVRAIGAASADVTDVNVTPSDNSAEVVWPSVDGAATYELVIKDKEGNVICTLIFNANGQLTQIAFNAPSQNGAPQQTQASGFSFTVTGLEQGTSYDLTITAKDENGATLDEKKQSFHTNGAESIDNISVDAQTQKIIVNGQVFIQRGNKLYTLQGQEVK